MTIRYSETRGPRSVPAARSPSFLLVLLLPFTIVGLASCSGGGGASSRDFDSDVVLVAVEFPDPRGINAEGESVPPTDAPLVQQVRFRFGGPPNPDSVDSQTLSVRDEAGFPAPGRLVVDGNEVVFTPLLPLTEPSGADHGGAGLFPGSTYFLRIAPSGWLREIDDELRARHADPSNEAGILLSFRTTTEASRYFLGLPDRSPKLVAADPADGSSNFSPGLYTDPAGRFPASRSILLHFDGPLSPSAVQLDRFSLVDLDHSRPGGLPLGVHTKLLANEVDRCTVELDPSGILPFGHTLSVEYPAVPRSLGNPQDPGDSALVAAVLSVAPATEDSIEDHVVETFDDRSSRDDDPRLLEPGQFPAAWDEDNSNSLSAGFAFAGSGELGRFLPPPPAKDDTRTVILDTNSQSFPLLDGSTPDAPPGLVVVGGVFSFTDVVIPDGVIIEARGGNPLRITATGTVRIAGRIDLSGTSGKSESAFDSAVTSLPGGLGGSGGGRGGESHPIRYFPPDFVHVLGLVSPPWSGDGWGPGNQERIGGTGGQCGHRDNKDSDGEYFTDRESSCGEFANHNDALCRTPGGGGGSMLERGADTPKNGKGNVLPDGMGGWILRTPATHGSTWRRLLPGRSGTAVFADADPLNDFIGVRGEHAQVFGGQGGGGGASMSDAYFCGRWCRIDEDPSNDEVCDAEFGNPPHSGDGMSDSRGGSGGGAGGAFQLQALGAITLEQTAVLRCAGATGGGGEQLSCSCWGASGGSGSGGAIVLESATGITVRAGALLDVQGGEARGASTSVEGCSGLSSDVAGAGGRGGHGIIQLQAPAGDEAIIEGNVATTMLPEGAWVDADNLRNPAAFSPLSAAVSVWFDMGRSIARPPADTNPLFRLRGLDPDGFVPTDAEGEVLNPEQLDLRCDYLGQLDPLRPGHYLEGQEPRADFIPRNATIQVQLQGAHAVEEGSKEVDPGSLTPWTADFAEVSAHQFVRYRILFDITADDSPLGPTTPRPTVQELRLRSEF